MSDDESLGAPTFVPTCARDGVARPAFLVDLIEAYRQRHLPCFFTETRKSYEGDQRARILDSYFADSTRAAVLLVDVGDRRLGRGPRTRLEYEAGTLTPEFDAVIRSCRVIERRAQPRLGRLAQLTVAQDMYTLLVYLLRTADHCAAEPERPDNLRKVDAATVVVRREAEEIETYVEESARQELIARYVLGLLPGLLVCAVLLVLSRWLPLDPAGPAPATLAIPLCIGAGGLGAVVSVLSRITSDRTDVSVRDRSKRMAMATGAFRPIIGAVFGALFFLVVAAGLLPLRPPHDATAGLLPFFAVVAFVAGFNERWAQDTLVRTVRKNVDGPGESRTLPPRTQKGAGAESSDSVSGKKWSSRVLR
ncbi:hypothetical protein PHK61_28720 [Actinomycetospora lutea]|uniref:hypothetical protein n=1 Tax=Actinomycetospora lutea TaxID=663604 RepID=UPI002365796E|nr:hypothetical protein [Actinomycetospora lutea]MDD7942406.1 hypothetical protein [Actinomycetospora lutea]